MNVLRSFRDRIAERALRISEFTALFPVGDAQGLERRLASDDAAQPQAYGKVLGLHDLRWFVFTPTVHSGEGVSRSTPRLLALACVFDGSRDDVIEGLVEHARNELEAVLEHCSDYVRARDLAGYLVRHRVESEHMFRDIGPLDPARGFGEVGDATRREIEDAFEAERRFETFYAAFARTLEPRALRARFIEAFGDDQFPFPLESVERSLPNEARWARRASELMRRMQARSARRARDGKRERAAHAKTHGVVPATFRVATDLPLAFRVGVFAEPGKQRRAVVRMSNGSEHLFGDRRRDARGLALSVDLSGDSELEASAFLLPPDAAGARQDFVLYTHPTFFATDVRRFVTLVSIASAPPSERVLPGLGFLASSAGLLRELPTLVSALSRRVVHPLAATFHSATPYRLGPSYVVKYSVEPRDPGRFAELRLGPEPDFLRRALAASLEQGPIEVDFYAHALEASQVPIGLASLSDAVEDATQNFEKLGARKIRLATVLIGDRPAETELTHECENWSFNPWNGLVAHRPLGSLNRARLLAYRESAAFRGALLDRQAPRESGVTPRWSWIPGSSRGGIRAAE